ncbi:MAG: hypothetical protein H7840_06475 [Alphaproteobacteria bacterium]
MSQTQAIVLAGVLVAGAVLVANTPGHSASPGPYAITAAGSSGFYAWRLDTVSGDVALCSYVGGAVDCVARK